MRGIVRRLIVMSCMISKEFQVWHLDKLSLGHYNLLYRDDLKGDGEYVCWTQAGIETFKYDVCQR